MWFRLIGHNQTQLVYTSSIVGYLNIMVIHIKYPNGDFNESLVRVKDIVLYYTCVYVLAEGWCQGCNTRPFKIPDTGM